MRRLVGISTRTSAVVAVLCAGAIYGAAEARQTILRRQRQEINRIEQSPIQHSGVEQQTVSSQTITLGPGSATARAAAGVAPIETGPESRVALSPATGATHRQIVISIIRRRLALLEDGKIIKTYPIAVGARGTPSPDGDYVIINHAKDPTYRHKGKVIEPGKANPLGTRWMGLSLKGYGIHGTNAPKSIGKAASHGCFRMAKTDVEDLYQRVQVGDMVSIHRDDDDVIAQVFPADSGPSGTAAANSETQLATAAAVSANGSTSDAAEQR